MFRKLNLIIAVTALVFTATACNTVKGVGQDITSVGKAGEEVMD